jgi:hypothetical protein
VVIAAVAVVGLLVVSVRPGLPVTAAPEFRIDVVATGIPRPIQLALDGQGRLVVLALGWQGDAAGEIYHLTLRGSTAVDGSRAPRYVIPFPEDSRKTVFGSLAADARSGDLYLGEENGNRIYRLTADHHLDAAVVGLNHLVGGGALALDGQRRLVFLDYASPESHLRSERRLPPSLSWLTEEGYRGPLVFRVDPREEIPLPRRADLLVPLVPRPGAPRADRQPQWRLISVAAAGDDLVFLSSVGEVFRLGRDGDLQLLARLPAGHYHRTNLAAAPDGSVFVCAGFQIRQILRVSPTGEVSVVASDLGDPGGIALDRTGAIYVPESALHRVIRISPATR